MATPQRGDARLQPGPPTKTIPFDYVFQCALQGTRGNKVQDVVEISSEGVFVALSVSYSLMLDEQRTARTFQPVVQQTSTLLSPVFVPLFSEFNDPRSFTGLLLTGIPKTEMAVLNLSNPTSQDAVRPARIEDDGTVVVSISLNSQEVRILRVWDKTHNLLSELFAARASPVLDVTPVIGPNITNKNAPVAGDNTVHVYGRPGDRVNVFLLEKSTGKFDEVGSAIVLDTITFTDERTGGAPVELRTGGALVELRKAGSPISLSPGDVLLVKIDGSTTLDIPLSMFVVRPRVVSDLTLAELEAGLEKIDADLTRGFRLNPNAANLVAADVSLAQLSDGRLGRIFETGSVAPEEVSFLYSFDIGSTGREYQSKPIHNIAGLGIANGDRPFRPFAKPMVFEPRSSIRLQIEELSVGTAGTLFVVLQGYKILGTGRIPG
jgi:hypothetical protein